MTLISVGRFDEALSIQQETIEFNKAMLPDNAEQNASALSAMATTLHTMRRYDEAIVLHEQVRFH